MITRSPAHSIDFIELPVADTAALARSQRVGWVRRGFLRRNPTCNRWVSFLNPTYRLTRDIFSFPGGRRFHFLEPAGNELAVWSEHVS